MLCLTYTKTAAAEMQNRLLDELCRLGHAFRTKTCVKTSRRCLGGRRDESEVPTARRLFAHTLEAKGGLKIHTIHGFCERLLQRFPLEAQVTPHFSVLDEREQALMRRAAFDAAVSRAAADSDGVLGRALAKVVALTASDYFRKIDRYRARQARRACPHGGVSPEPGRLGGG